ncbi:valyl-tRNA synthetase [Commensalibacter intestini A911]|uniref:Valine--tRNA ligase n=2 Tax=Commensalibacter intestini TaxID=479936 RepID=A0A251ZXI7_9PROT|nr:valine--tRNA ligase [Commensalibacter intestini]EHD14835.1 valyl-tRNA synthetase [Commensalibacter intestini A911]OUI79371.1 valyl-tRNA synthetase [Commensalibacter intestini]
MLEKKFIPSAVENDLYHLWEESGFFSANPERQDKKPFAIMIPPPNVTGTLHIGHALTMTLQDTLIRWRRMQGYDVLWQPGTDHAGISTQLVVDRKLTEKGIDRKSIGRDEFIKHVWEWKAESGGEITKQLRRLGASLDWKRERFTMDEGLSEAVKKVFVTLYREGLIYQDKRLVNWDPVFRSAVSDLEVESKEVNGHLWYIHYPIKDTDEIITIATTRPETMLGDVAVAVHPENEKYKHLVGKNIILPLTGRLIPIIADEYSDPEKGTGAVKITPAHDFNDFEVGRRHDLKLITILDESAAIDLSELSDNEKTEFVLSLDGQPRDKARKQIIAELERLELLEKAEPHRNQVPHAERGGAVIEPRLTTQWYCDAPTLAKPAIEAVQTDKIKFVPKQWENTYFSWMRDLQPWCISRQLWWGHQIPAWYGPDNHVFVAYDENEAKEQALKHYGSEQPLRRDEDVLDTWFSSALWPFSTLGWPNDTAEVNRYYPGNVLITGFDIIFFWVARMMMMGMHFMKDIPFETVYLHGLVRDEKGQKMSKTKGNGIDPLEVIDEFGADAMRFTVCALTGPGRDIKLGKKRIEEYRSFITKIWNAARFCEMNEVKYDPNFSINDVKLSLNRWILGELSQAITDATSALESFRYDEYASVCYHFTWDKFCDWFLEFAKAAFQNEDKAIVQETRAVAAIVLKTLLQILHPVIPFVTETLWDEFNFGKRGTLMVSEWPNTEPFATVKTKESSNEIDWVVRFITEIRTLRAEMNVPPAKFISALLKDANAETLNYANLWGDAVKRMARVESIQALQGDIPKDSAQTVINEATIILPLDGIIDIEAEKKRLAKELTKIADELQKLNTKLSNESFLQKARPEVIEESRERMKQLSSDQERIQTALKHFE